MHLPNPIAWSIMGKTGKPKSFTAAVAKPTQPCLVAPQPAPVVPIPGRPVNTLTHAQLNTLQKSQIINAIDICFHTRVQNQGASKSALIALYLWLVKNDPTIGQVIPVGQADTYVRQQQQQQQQQQHRLSKP